MLGDREEGDTAADKPVAARVSASVRDDVIQTSRFRNLHELAMEAFSRELGEDQATSGDPRFEYRNDRIGQRPGAATVCLRLLRG